MADGSVKIPVQLEVDDINKLRADIQNALSKVKGTPITKELQTAVKDVNTFLKRTEDLSSSIKSKYSEMLDTQKRSKQLAQENFELEAKRAQLVDKLDKKQQQLTEYSAEYATAKKGYLDRGLTPSIAEKRANATNASTPYINKFTGGEVEHLGMVIPVVNRDIEELQGKLAEIDDKIAENNATIKKGTEDVTQSAQVLGEYKNNITESQKVTQQHLGSWDTLLTNEHKAVEAEQERLRLLEQEKAEREEQAKLASEPVKEAPPVEESKEEIEQTLSEADKVQQQIDANLATIEGYKRSVEELREAGYSPLDTAKIEEEITALEEENERLESVKASLTDVNSISGDIDMTKNAGFSEVEEMASRLRDSMQDIIDSTAGEQLSSRLMSLQDHMDKLIQKSIKTSEALASIQDVTVPSDQYVEQNRLLDEELARVVKLKNAKEQMEIAGKTDSASYQQTVMNLDEAQLNVEAMTAELTKMRELGEDTVTIPKEATAEYQKQLQIQSDINSQMRIYIEKWNETIAKIDEANAKQGERAQHQAQLSATREARQPISDASRALGSLTTSTRSLGLLIPGLNTRAIRGVTMLSRAVLRLSTLSAKDLVNGIKAVGNAFSALGKAVISHPILLVIGAIIAAIVKLKKTIDETKKQVDELGKVFVKGLQTGLKTVVNLLGKMGKLYINLGTSVLQGVARGVQLLINKLMSLKGVVTENLKLMAKWHNGNNAVNKSLSNITSSLAYLKGAIASVVVPILTTVEPIITSIIDKLAEAITMIGMFIAKLMGATSFQKAIRVQKDYAKAIEGTGNAAKNALSPLDNLNVISSQSGGGAVDWEDVTLADFEIPDWLTDLYELGTTVGVKIRDFLQSIPWDSVKKGAQAAAQGISDFINGVLSVKDFGKTFGDTFAEALNTLTLFANTILTKLHFDKLGEQLGQMMQGFVDTLEWDDLGQVFSNSLNDLALTFNNLFKNFDGSSLGEGLTELFQNAFGNINWTLIKDTVINGMRDVVGALNEIITPSNFKLLADTITESFESIFVGIKTFAEEADWEQWGDSIATGIMELFASFDATSAGQTVQKLADGLLTMLETAINAINWSEISDTIIEFISNIDWANLASRAGDISKQLIHGLQAVFESIRDTDAFDGIIDLIVTFLNEKKNWEKAFKKFKRELIWEILKEKISQGFEAFAEGFLEVTENIGDEIGELLTAMTDAFNLAFTGDSFAEIGKNILLGIGSGLVAAIDLIISPIRMAVEGIINGFCNLFGIHSPATELEPVGENIILGILEGFGLVDFANKMTAWWDENIAPWFSLEKWKGIADNIKTALSEKMEEISESMSTKWTQLKDGITTKVEELKIGLADKWTAIQEGFLGMWENIKNGIKEPINGIIGMIEGLVNKIIDGINWLIEKLNTVSFDIPDWVPEVGGESFGISLNALNHVTIPRLATGGVVPPSMAEHLAVLGDNNAETEVVSPLSTMKEALLEALAESGIGNGTQEINLIVDGREIMKAMVKQNSEYKKQHNGASAFS